MDEGAEGWPIEAGTCGYVVRGGGSIIAFRLGAHTDSPNLRIKPRPDRNKHGYHSLLVEVYGGVLLSTWTDRDLSIAGRVTMRTPTEPAELETRLLHVDRPLCRIPNLAIHLDRDINEKGAKLNPQDHMAPIWTLGDDEDADEGGFRRFLAGELGVEAQDVLSWDMCLYDTQPSCASGKNNEFIHAPRLDNLGCSHASLCALAEGGDPLPRATSVIALFDHEEIGSRTASGANSAFLRDVLERICGGSRTELSRASSHSILLSCDMAHAVHPHRPERHDPGHLPKLNGGPALKTSARWNYATQSETGGWLQAVAAAEGIELQDYNHRSDQRCGSTIGPIVAAELGVACVELGNPMLSMHSAREMGGSQDPQLLVRLLKRAFAS